VVASRSTAVSSRTPTTAQPVSVPARATGSATVRRANTHGLRPPQSDLRVTRSEVLGSEIDEAPARWDTRARDVRLQSPLRSIALWCGATLLALTAAASPTAAGSTSRASSTIKPALVWSTSVFVEDLAGHWRERTTLWIGAADGSHPRIIGTGKLPQISPDGRWVAFTRDDNAYVVSSAGGQERLVARDGLFVRWSPTSRLVATIVPGRALYVTDMQTRRRVTIDRNATIGGVSFSPSGEEMVWARQPGRAYSLDRDMDLFRARVDGSGKTRLTRGGRNAAPVWGARRIAFGRIRPGKDVHFPIYELWTMQSGGDGLERVTRTSHVPLEWSADGRRLLTSTYNTKGAVGSVVDVETKNVRVLVKGKTLFPLALSRDGRSLLAWIQRGLNPPFGPRGDLVRVNWDKSQTTLVRNGDQLADWNL
jgi:hypothetical protein